MRKIILDESESNKGVFVLSNGEGLLDNNVRLAYHEPHDHGKFGIIYMPEAIFEKAVARYLGLKGWELKPPANLECPICHEPVKLDKINNLYFVRCRDCHLNSDRWSVEENALQDWHELVEKIIGAIG